MLNEPRGKRQEHKLTGGGTGREHAKHETAVPSEPSARYDGSQHKCGKTATDTDHKAPQNEQLPNLGHKYCAEKPARDEQDSGEDDVAHAKPFDESR